MTGRAVPNAVATAQITGARDNQEDFLAVHVLAAGEDTPASEVLLALADGMGGHASGEVASKLVVEQFTKAYVDSSAKLPEALISSLNIANEQLANAVEAASELRGMGATLTGCVIRDDRLYWVSVGDSPLWVCRDAKLQRLNADHSMVPLLDDMVRTGVMDREDALVDSRRNMLRSAVTGKALELVDLCDEPYLLQAGDFVILASDGVETLADDQLVAELLNPNDKSLQVLADNLMALIEMAGYSDQDNASVVLYGH